MLRKHYLSRQEKSSRWHHFWPRFKGYCEGIQLFPIIPHVKIKMKAKGQFLETLHPKCSVWLPTHSLSMWEVGVFLNQWSHKSSSRTEVEFFPTLLSQIMLTIKDQSGLHKAAFIPLIQQWASWKQYYEAMLDFFEEVGGHWGNTSCYPVY